MHQLDSKQIGLREKLILAGLYLSKFDIEGLRKIGFESFTEAFNVLGYALGGKPSTIKNYRDEFDPLFPNHRAGWHQRPLRQHCIQALEKYGNLDIENFSNLLIAVTGIETEKADRISGDADGSSFANRMITGLATEHYFENIHSQIPDFKDYRLENTTRLGCGYDFKLISKLNLNFLAVEVKGLNLPRGTISLTAKEYEVATALENRFYLFVVRNFRETPIHNCYQNPISSDLGFTKREKLIVQISWSASI